MDIAVDIKQHYIKPHLKEKEEKEEKENENSEGQKQNN